MKGKELTGKLKAQDFLYREVVVNMRTARQRAENKDFETAMVLASQTATTIEAMKGKVKGYVWRSAARYYNGELQAINQAYSGLLNILVN